ncbi:MAG: NAD(P)H-dependent oxidoreductase [Rhodospirillales bacterium]|nr:NAD(P)H-dependent oxidoreductase [Rhodospirillales bacterium]
MTKILGLSGSLRRASFNSGLLRAAKEVAPAGVEVEIGSIADVPLYNGDIEAEQGVPEGVKILHDQLRGSAALLLVTPEYNNGVPGVFKNAIDWMSSGHGAALFRNKPAAVIGASPGGFGTILAQAHWLPVLRALGMHPWFEGRLMVLRAGAVFDKQGNLSDHETRKRLADFMAGFAAAL